ncbi:Coatomer subunit gamma (CopG) [Monocercomonoides exilis]|uniref:Coatomer subunit gamma (CopG) n=1 Tax=Monocercomonoides exilis TaxID=2049356 RepID=UPI00355A3C8E|nr:Coatomer subunit gamma (CopG) [Monocercomonoides exilis]|eukprot:MONOS_11374.1-p1 / transcript=MONOS_11374.1 / gene=MONOS_11374 / organism=Monocercomonoides_exilis_PA203 / gene_product= Coatomer subunit gamma (CopG) / transcript_product= Coatomer subunit gamma (CopG) / location=Mono_scaffold00567:30588-35037(-) / protein_length=1158 / sequence_SO=supercontig / SO=protein_coding / is_pseudo=false
MIELSRREQEDGVVPFDGVSKEETLQQARAFNTHGSKPSKCRVILCRILWLIHSGEYLSEPERASVFFRTTNLFMQNDVHLHRLLFLACKSLRPSQDNVIIVTSSLTKDITSETPGFRANALRVLAQIVDNSFLLQVEKYFQAALVDPSSEVASASLLACIKIAKTNPEAVRRWIASITDCLTKHRTITQYHALAAFHAIRKDDPLSVAKVLLTEASQVRNHLAQCLQIRYAAEVLLKRHPPRQMNRQQQNSFRDGGNGEWNDTDRKLLKVIESGFDSVSEKVQIEALQGIFKINQEAQESDRLTVVLSTLLRGSDSSTRFATLRAIHNHYCPNAGNAHSSPSLSLLSFLPCTLLESLLSDDNKQTATWAAVLLLSVAEDGGFAIGSSSSSSSQSAISGYGVEKYTRLIVQLEEAQQIELIDAAVRFGLAKAEGKRTAADSPGDASFSPSSGQKKSRTRGAKEEMTAEKAVLCVMTLLSSSLHVEGRKQMKSKAIDSIITLMNRMPSIQSEGLTRLCEFVEDCDDSSLSRRINRLFSDATAAWKDQHCQLRRAESAQANGQSTAEEEQLKVKQESEEDYRKLRGSSLEAPTLFESRLNNALKGIIYSQQGSEKGSAKNSSLDLLMDAASLAGLPPSSTAFLSNLKNKMPQQSTPEQSASSEDNNNSFVSQFIPPQLSNAVTSTPASFAASCSHIAPLSSSLISQYAPSATDSLPSSPASSSIQSVGSSSSSAVSSTSFASFDPSHYVRALYNRALLEDASVRASAISSLASIALHAPHLRKDIVTLLKRFKDDENDEVRDRLVYLLSALSDTQESTDDESLPTKGRKLGIDANVLFETALPSTMLLLRSTVARQDLEEDAEEETAGGKGDSSAGERERDESGRDKRRDADDLGSSGRGSREDVVLKHLGLTPVFKRSAPVALTEPETEFAVSVTKLISQKQIGLMYEVTNTVKELQLRTVQMDVTSSDCIPSLLQPSQSVAIRHLDPEQTLPTFVTFTRSSDEIPIGTLSTTMRFISHELDPTGKPYEDGVKDSYQLRSLHFSLSDFVKGAGWGHTWNTEWEANKNSSKRRKLRLPRARTVAAALELLTTTLSLASDTMDEIGDNTEKIQTRLSGLFVDGTPIVGQAEFALQSSGVDVSVELRSRKVSLAEMLLSLL